MLMPQLAWQWIVFPVFLFAFNGSEARLPDLPAGIGEYLVASPQFLGSGLNADALSNTRIGGPYQTTTSFGFRSPHSGLLSSVRLYVIWSATSSGYNGGTGGSLLVRIQPDDGTARHHPSGQTLASYLHTQPMNKGSFPLLLFSAPAHLRKGMIYHVVITNPDPDPVTNYVSVNSLWMRTALKPCQPTLADSDWFQLLGSRSNPASWTSISTGQSDSYTPILELNYAEGFSAGVGYMEVWGENPKVVSGTKAVRQLLTMNPADQNVTRVSARLRRLSGSDSLIAQIQNAAGVTVARGAVPASKVPTGYSWVNFDLGNRQLLASQKYTLEFRCAATSSYDLYPIRKGDGAAIGFRSSLFFEGYAQFTTGGAWKGWDQWGQPDRRDGDLQFYLTFTPDPPESPQLKSPLNGAVDIPRTPDLIWYESPLASLYHVQVGDDSLFGPGLFVNDSTVVDTTIRVTVLGSRRRYFWRVRALNTGGSSSFGRPFTFLTSGSVANSSTPQITNFQVYPNPLSVRTHVTYDLTTSGFVLIEIVNVLGARVATLYAAYQEEGPHLVEWNASSYPVGPYFCTIRSGSSFGVREMIVVR